MPSDYLKNIDLAHYQAVWKARLRVLSNRYWAYCSILSNRVSALHLVGAGNTSRRLLSLAWQREGVQVFSYNHGGNLHLASQRFYFLMQEAIWGNLVCPNKTIAKNMSQTYAHLSLGKNYQKPNYLCSSNVDLDASAIVQRQRYSVNQQLREMLLVGFPMHNKRYLDGDGLFFYFRLDLELRLASYLTSIGYKVSYKVHPEYSGKVGPIWKNKGIKVVGGAFEEVWQRYDAAVFTDLASTPTGFALTTNMPIVITLLQTGGLSSEAYQALSHRASIVPLTWSKSNRLTFDQSNLKQAIIDAPRKCDDISFWENHVRYQWQHTRGR